MTDAELAAHLAETAGRILQEVRASGVFAAKALGAAGDQTANQFLVHALRAARPDDALLSEEMKCDGARLSVILRSMALRNLSIMPCSCFRPGPAALQG